MRHSQVPLHDPGRSPQWCGRPSPVPNRSSCCARRGSKFPEGRVILPKGRAILPDASATFPEGPVNVPERFVDTCASDRPARFGFGSTVGSHRHTNLAAGNLSKVVGCRAGGLRPVTQASWAWRTPIHVPAPGRPRIDATVSVSVQGIWQQDSRRAMSYWMARVSQRPVNTPHSSRPQRSFRKMPKLESA